jgi:CRISPR/Cas system-associated exonuclease Cas4 (RecB family)
MVQWSYSSLKDYLNCPKQYYHLKVAQDYVKKPTENMLYGSEVHKALEDYVRDGKPLAKNYERFKAVLDELIAIPGTKYPEHKMALTREKKVCAFDDKERWVRGIVDLLIVDGDTAYIVDYKTGNNRYPDPKQLKLMALMTYAHFPEVNQIKAGLLFILRNAFVPEEYERNQIDELWTPFNQDITRLELSYENSAWPASPSGLCGWCPVDSCKFHKQK